VAVSAIAVFLAIKSPKRLPIAIGLLFVAPSLVLFMPDNWVDRMRTIETYEQDGSAMGRINSWKMLTNLANDRPMIGGGFECYTAETFARYAPDPSTVLSAHSIYFQVLGEHGWVALIMFLAVWLFTWRDASAIIRMSKSRANLKWAGQLAAMLQVSLIGYFVGGAFLNLAYWDMPYYLLVAVVVTHDIVRREVETSVPESPPSGAESRGAAIGGFAGSAT
jgi:probable O-glycosylation ligase (exosortase A-associated)